MDCRNSDYIFSPFVYCVTRIIIYDAPTLVHLPCRQECAQREKIYFCFFFPARLLPTVQNGSDVLWCFVAVQIFLLYFLFIRRYKGNKQGKEWSEGESEKWSVKKNMYAKIHVTANDNSNSNNNNNSDDSGEKYIITNGNLPQIWITWRPDLARLSIHFMLAEWRNIEIGISTLDFHAQPSARKTIGKQFTDGTNHIKGN